MEDILKVLRIFGHVMALSAPHIYISVLPILPNDTLLAKKYKKNCGSIIKLKQGNMSFWPVQDSLLTGHQSGVKSVAYSPDGQFIVSGSYDSTVRIWNANSGQPVGQPLEGHTSSINSVAHSPDGQFIVSGSLDSTVRIWNANSGQPVGQPLEGHTESINSVA